MVISKQHALLGVVLILGLFLYFPNLGNIYLWQDEAQTALISQTVLQHGIPKGTDGRNFFSQELGAEYGENYTYRWHTWLPFYVVAAVFKLFGSSTYTARLPFAIFGLGCVFLTYFFSRRLFNSERTAALGTLVLLFSIPFILLSRQCRYYSMAAFFSVLTAFGYLQLLAGKKRGALLYFVAATLLFHTFYIYVATLIAALTVHLALFHRHRWKPFLVATLAILVFNGPWIIWLAGMNYAEQYGSVAFALGPSLERLSGFAQDIFRYFFPPYLLLIPVLVLAYERLYKKKAFRLENEWLAAISLPVFFIGSTVIALTLTAPDSFIRYLAPLIPFCAILVGAVFAHAMQIHKVMGLVLVAVLIYLSPIRDYLYELSHDYDGPIEGIATYLNEHADPDDVVAITYGDMPLKFYTDLRIVGGLTGEDLAPAKSADWVIIRRTVLGSKDAKVRNFLIKNIDARQYQRVEIDYPDLPFENRETPYEHRYRTVTNYPPVIIYKRK